jgi:tripartite-type tricarboxylate transporter receptor subunit TctC
MPVPQRPTDQMLKTIAIAASSIALMALSGASHAQAYPSRTISLAMPIGPNVAYYHMVRQMADLIQARTGATIAFDPTLGANGVLTPAKVKRSEPDGHTIGLVFASAMTMEPLVWKDRLYDPLTDFAYLTMLTQHGIVFLARNGFAPNNLTETIAFAKANPEVAKVGTASTAGLVGLVQIEDAAGIKFFKVPYKSSGQFDAAILAGEIDMIYQAAGTAIGLVKGGRMKALFIGSRKRSPLLPNVQSISEVIPNIEVGSWYALIAAAGTPADRVNWHVREWGAALKDPKIADSLEKQQGFEVVGSTPQALADQVKRELAANQGTIKKYNIKE